MRTTHAATGALLGLLLIAAGGCSTADTSPTEPGALGAVVIEVQITGGVMGLNNRLQIEGHDRVVHRSCEGCPADAGSGLKLTGQQWLSLVDEAQHAGLPALGERDFGASCCDFFHFEIRYADEGGRAVVRGDQNTLPPALAALARRLLMLNSGVLPALVRPGDPRGSGPDDPVQIEQLGQGGEVLDVAVLYGGGCGPHAIDLVFDGRWRESSPVQTSAWLTHDSGGDICLGAVRETRRFDLADLFAAYRALYPGDPSGTQILVDVSAPGGATQAITLTLP